MFFIDIFVCLVKIVMWLSTRIRQKAQKESDINEPTDVCQQGGTDVIEYPLQYP